MNKVSGSDIFIAMCSFLFVALCVGGVMNIPFIISIEVMTKITFTLLLALAAFHARYKLGIKEITLLYPIVLIIMYSAFTPYLNYTAAVMSDEPLFLPVQYWGTMTFHVGVCAVILVITYAFLFYTYNKRANRHYWK